MGEVTIAYKDKPVTLDIEDISPDTLQEVFELPDPPKFLRDVNSNKIILSKNWGTQLKKGSLYRIKEQATSTDIVKEYLTDYLTDDNFKEIVLHALIASTAAYKIKHSDNDINDLKTYLYQQMNNHYFDEVILSKHGENFFFIAKQYDANRIYVAFRNSTGLLDVSHTLQVNHGLIISIS